MKMWAESLLTIPSTLAENAGLSPIATTTQLVRDHHNSRRDRNDNSNSNGNRNSHRKLLPCYSGVDVLQHKISDLSQLVWEPLALKQSILTMATQMACQVLKIDEVIYV